MIYEFGCIGHCNDDVMFLDVSLNMFHFLRVYSAGSYSSINSFQNIFDNACTTFQCVSLLICLSLMQVGLKYGGWFPKKWFGVNTQKSYKLCEGC